IARLQRLSEIDHEFLAVQRKEILRRQAAIGSPQTIEPWTRRKESRQSFLHRCRLGGKLAPAGAGPRNSEQLDGDHGISFRSRGSQVRLSSLTRHFRNRQNASGWKA